ncbi:CD209 antigen-like protein A [Oculina patagonica]
MDLKAAWKILCFLPIILIVTCSQAQAGVCSNNWIYMEGSCYNFSSDALNWTAAKSACEALGSNLVVINSRDEQQAIAAKVSQRTWIGLYRNPKNTSRWLWVDGSPVNYTNWARGEPNSPNSEECGEMYPNGKWNDKECYAPRPFVCETRGTYIKETCHRFSMMHRFFFFKVSND